MKKLITILLGLNLVATSTVGVIVYKNSKEPAEIQIDIPVARDLGRVEAKIDAIYEECKLRDSTIFRTLLDLRQEITGEQSINERDKIAGL